MTNRFEELEEQLKQLETIPVVSTVARVHAPEGRNIDPVGAQQGISPNTQKPSGASAQVPGSPGDSDQLKAESEEEPTTPGALGRVASAVSSIRGRRWRTRLLKLEEQAVGECQERMREVVGGVIEDAKRQLEDLTNELVPTFQMRLERSIKDSVVTLTSPPTQELEQQEPAPPRRGAAVASISEREGVAQARGEWSEGAHDTEVEQTLAGNSIGKELAQAFRPVVKEVEVKSAAFLDRLNLQLHSTLQAFGEKATKHAAEEFARIAVEVLQAGGGRLGPARPRTDVQKSHIEREEISAVRSVRHKGKSFGMIGNGPDGGACKRVSPNSRGAEKVLPGAANWRILGLG
jgi:hypothetical protein